MKEKLNEILLAYNIDNKTKLFDFINDFIPELIKCNDSMETPPYHIPETTLSHILRVVENCPKDIILKCAALFHDVAKPVCRKFLDGHYVFHGHAEKGAIIASEIMVRLGYQQDDITPVALLIKNHMRPKLFRGRNQTEAWSNQAIIKYAKDMGDILDKSLTLTFADIIGSSEPEVEKGKLIVLNELKQRLSEAGFRV